MSGSGSWLSEGDVVSFPSLTSFVSIVLCLLLLVGLLREARARNSGAGLLKHSGAGGAGAAGTAAAVLPLGAAVRLQVLRRRGGGGGGGAAMPLPHFDFGAAEAQGRRPYMEDRCLVVGELGGQPQTSLFAVFDGHGGAQAADFCVDRMAAAVAADRDFPHNAVRALTSAFLRVDDEFVTAARAARPVVDDGTTSLVVLAQGTRLSVANAGDSRALLVQRNGRVEPLSVDHKPNRPDEALRIRLAGGQVFFHGVWRVSGVLAVSRAVGDRLLKPFVTARPEVQQWEVGVGDCCLVLATDGLWDVLSHRDVAEIVLQSQSAPWQGQGAQGQGQGQAQRCAERLVRAALDAGSADNVTALVVDLSCRFLGHSEATPPSTPSAQPSPPSLAAPIATPPMAATLPSASAAVVAAPAAPPFSMASAALGPGPSPGELEAAGSADGSQSLSLSFGPGPGPPASLPAPTPLTPTQPPTQTLLAAPPPQLHALAPLHVAVTPPLSPFQSFSPQSPSPLATPPPLPPSPAVASLTARLRQGQGSGSGAAAVPSSSSSLGAAVAPNAADSESEADGGGVGGGVVQSGQVEAQGTGTAASAAASAAAAAVGLSLQLGLSLVQRAGLKAE